MSRIEVGKAGSDNDQAGFFEDHKYIVEWKDVTSINEWKELLLQEQTQDKSINIAKEQIEKEGKVRLGRYKNYKQLFLQDGLVVKSGRILVPNSLKYQIVREYHSTDHWGTENTYTCIAEKYYWPNMRNYIQTYCSSCDICLQTKHPNTKPRSELKPQKWCEYFPRQAIALDLATMVPSYDGYRYIMLIVDGTSKFVELCQLRNITASSVVKNIKREWIGRHGVPNTLLADQGQQVDGEEVREMCRDYNIKKKRSTPYHPEGDGISERHIGVMKGLFCSKLLQKKLPQRRWTEVLPDVQLAMNSKKHASARYSPFELMYGENGNKGNRIPQQNAKKLWYRKHNMRSIKVFKKQVKT